jgi:catalase
MVASLLNVSEELGAAVALALGMETPEPMPPTQKRAPKSEVAVSPALSLTALPGSEGVRTRKVALIIAQGVKAEPVAMLVAALSAAGAVPKLLSTRLGTIRSMDGQEFEVDATLENMPAVLFDALVLPDGEEAVTRLVKDGRVIDFLKDQYRHGKTIWVGAASAQLLDSAGVAQKLPSGDADPGLITGSPARLADQISEFIAALGKHRHPRREEELAVVQTTGRRRQK